MDLRPEIALGDVEAGKSDSLRVRRFLAWTVALLLLGFLFVIFANLFSAPKEVLARKLAWLPSGAKVVSINSWGSGSFQIVFTVPQGKPSQAELRQIIGRNGVGGAIKPTGAGFEQEAPLKMYQSVQYESGTGQVILYRVTH